MSFTPESIKLLKHLVTQKRNNNLTERERQLREEHKHLSSTIRNQEHALKENKVKLSSIEGKLDALLKESQTVKDALKEIESLENSSKDKDRYEFQNYNLIRIVLEESAPDNSYKLGRFIAATQNKLFSVYGIEEEHSDRDRDIQSILEQYFSIVRSDDNLFYVYWDSLSKATFLNKWAEITAKANG